MKAQHGNMGGAGETLHLPLFSPFYPDGRGFGSALKEYHTGNAQKRTENAICRTHEAAQKSGPEGRTFHAAPKAEGTTVGQ